MSAQDDSELDGDAIAIINWQEHWDDSFQIESDALSRIFSTLRVGTEHIGSTAIKGMVAKPVIDIMLGIEGYRGGVEYDEPITSLGYVNAVEPQQLLPCTRFFVRRDSKQRRSHHLHLVELNSEFWTSRLLFRDYLREHRAVARVYGELKKRGAQRYRYDRPAYNRFKESFIQACIVSAGYSR